MQHRSNSDVKNGRIWMEEERKDTRRQHNKMHYVHWMRRRARDNAGKTYQIARLCGEFRLKWSELVGHEKNGWRQQQQQQFVALSCFIVKPLHWCYTGIPVLNGEWQRAVAEKKEKGSIFCRTSVSAVMRRGMEQGKKRWRRQQQQRRKQHW